MQFVDMLLEKLSERAKTKEPLNIVQWLNFTTFDIIGELSFSEPFFCLENNGYHPWVSFIFRGIQGAALRRFLHYYPLLEWLVQTVNLSSKMKSILQIRSSAKDKAKARMAHGLQPLHDHADFIYYMLKPTRDGADGMSAKEALANSPTLVIAGSETTATALSGFCFYISRNAKAYALLAGEIRAAFAQEEDINLRSTASLEYLQACINEILRAYISVYQWATFRNPENFVEPDSYLPERWLSETHELYEERFSSDKRAVFKPFSHGPRDCIGKNLAFAEMRLIICRLLLRFDFELAHPQDHWHDNQRTFGLWEKGPLYLRLTERSVTE
ncbi:hypothetical protein CDD83_3884 [Cordyceps sp. RAO-2017]|nr:hypothetical protein CDD83_3884 [Cordyceps sp. RAO-2017]